MDGILGTVRSCSYRICFWGKGQFTKILSQTSKLNETDKNNGIVQICSQTVFFFVL